MSEFDLSDAFDSEFVDTFTVRRQAETLVGGRTVITPSDIPGVYGTVCAASPNDLLRIPDSTSFTRAISIVTQTKLIGASEGYQPDLVLWQGSAYLVVHVDLYPHFGPGWYQVIATSTTSREPV